MEDRILRGTGIHVSRICLGAMTFGDQVDEKTSLEMLNYAYDNGVYFIDTANAYSGGESEKIVGKMIKDKRENVVVATKVGYPVVQVQSDKHIGLSRKYILSAVEDSLKRLNTDYIDIYYMHSPLYNCPVEEALFTFTELVRSGKVRYIGVSNQAAWQICEQKWCANTKGYIAPIITQNGYNLIARSIESELVSFVEKHDFALVNYNPLAGGLLTGKQKAGGPVSGTRFDGNKMYLDRYWNEQNFKAVDRLAIIASEAGISLPELALRWCISHDYINSMLIGASKMDQLKQNIDIANKGALDAQTMQACDEVWTELSGKLYKYNR